MFNNKAGIFRWGSKHLISAPYRLAHSAAGEGEHGHHQHKEKSPGPPVLRELHLDGAAWRLVLNRPERRNPLSLATLGLLHDELEAAERDPRARAVILAANMAGNGVFSAGHDLRELRTGHELAVPHRALFQKCLEVMELVQRMQLPVIAEVDGLVAAAGTQLVASTDIVVASPRSRFVCPGVKNGLFCSTPGIPLARALPRKLAADMLLTARALDGEEAHRWGLVSRLVPHGECVGAEALEVAGAIVALSRPVVAMGKAFFYAQLEQSTHTANRQGAATMCANLELADAQEGIAAFLEKRQPRWTHSAEKHPNSHNKKN